MKENLFSGGFLASTNDVVPMEFGDFFIQFCLLLGLPLLMMLGVLLCSSIIVGVYKRIIYKKKIKKLWKALRSEDIVVDHIKRPIENLFYNGSDVKKYFKYIEVLFNNPIYENPDKVPVCITKMKLKREILTLYVDVIQKEYEFEVLSVYNNFIRRNKSLGDDGVRLKLYAIDIGEVSVVRHKCKIPHDVKKGDRIKLKFAPKGGCIELVYIGIVTNFEKKII